MSWQRFRKRDALRAAAAQQEIAGQDALADALWAAGWHPGSCYCTLCSDDDHDEGFYEEGMIMYTRDPDVFGGDGWRVTPYVMQTVITDNDLVATVAAVLMTVDIRDADSVQAWHNVMNVAEDEQARRDATRQGRQQP